jgi:hypothetical protein
MSGMVRQPVEFYVSNIGGPNPRVLARFTTDDRGLHIERLDRTEGRWVRDNSVGGFALGMDDWAERASKDQASEVIASWGFEPALVDAPVTVVASA